jgi:ATP-dependent Clp protease ATP-binding subunit ClpA
MAVFERLDTDARLVFELAHHEARSLDHNYVGTEHLLVGLAMTGGNTAELLAARDCRAENVRGEILSIIGRGRPSCRETDALLATLGIDLAEVRRRVESTFGSDAIPRAAQRVRPRRRWPGHRWWPGCDRGRPCDSALAGGPWLGLAPRVKRVVEMAVARAAPAAATPLHLLLAILDEGKGVACQILAARNVDMVALHAAALEQLGSR